MAEAKKKVEATKPTPEEKQAAAEAELAFQFLLGDMAMAIQILGHGTAVVRFHCS